MKKVEISRLKLAGVLYIGAITALVLALSYSAEVRKPIEEEEIPEEPVAVQEVVTEKVEEVVVTTSKTPEQEIDAIVDDICTLYDKVDPYLVKSVIYHESRYNPRAINKDGTCVGLMQVSTFWHKSRAFELGVEDFFDPEGNILLGVDYLQELFQTYESPELVLMLYNMKHNDAFEMYNKGEISYYAKSVLERAEMLKNGGV